VSAPALDRRSLLALALGGLAGEAAAADPWSVLAEPSSAALLRHAATTGGVGDPAGFRLDACETQRNLSEAGRASARRLGAAFRARGIAVSRVLSSQWCRCLETAELMALGPVEASPDALNSFFDERGERERRTAALRQLLGSAPRGAAALVLVTHQVNITALTGVFPREGETLALRLTPDGGFALAGRLPPP
jgi:phosphohistidine phosphatase SixA